VRPGGADRDRIGRPETGTIWRMDASLLVIRIVRTNELTMLIPDISTLLSTMLKMKLLVKSNAPTLNNLCADLSPFTLPTTNVSLVEMTELQLQRMVHYRIVLEPTITTGTAIRFLALLSTWMIVEIISRFPA
jgi:hypothetical protein